MSNSGELNEAVLEPSKLEKRLRARPGTRPRSTRAGYLLAALALLGVRCSASVKSEADPTGESADAGGTAGRGAGGSADGGGGTAGRGGNAATPADGGAAGDRAGSDGTPGTGGTGATDASAGGASADGGPMFRPHRSDFVFDDARLRTWSFTLTPADWQKLQDTAWQEIYVPAMLRVETEEGPKDVGTVGIRYKGSWGSWQGCFTSPGTAAARLRPPTDPLHCKKISFKIDFTEYDASKRFYGLRKINLHAQRSDASHMRERLGYAFFRRMGILAGRSVHARVMINGQYKGLFGLTEAIDGEFGDYWFPKSESDGNLYKQTWPSTDDPAYYIGAPGAERGQKTNEPKTPPVPGRNVVPPDKIRAFHRALVAAPAADRPRVLDGWMDAAYLARYMAADRALGLFDGISACYGWKATATGLWCNGHNFYIYESPTANRLWLIPWDLDGAWNTFGGWQDLMPPWDQPPADCSTTRYCPWGGGNRNSCLPHFGCDPLIRAWAGTGLYRQAVRDMLAGPLDVAKLQADVDRWAAQIEPAVMADANGPGVVAWRSGVAALKNALPLIRKRQEGIAGLLPARETDPILLRIGGVSGFEAASQFGYDLAVRATKNETSAITRQGVNTTAPLAGAQDLRIEFELRNQSDGPAGAHSQFAGMRFYIQNSPTADLRALREIRLRLKADSTRPVRVTLESSARNRSNVPINQRLGWDALATPAGERVTLSAADARFASWAPPSTEYPAVEILEWVTRIYIGARARGLDAGGLLPAGTADRGWLQIDDVEIVVN